MFFPLPPPNPLLGADQDNYPIDIPNLPGITKDQIRRHAAKLRPHKAPGPDGIPNVVLTRSINIIIEHLLYIFQAIFTLNTFYLPWQQWNTIVLQKPGRPRYDIAKSYHPIALINTLPKLLNSIIAELTIHYGESHNLLPPTHFGGRPGRTTTDAIDLLTQTVKQAWRSGQVVSALFLDIEGAFPNATTERLIHNMRKRGLPRELIRFAQTVLVNRQTTLCFDGYKSLPIPINNGIGQGDPDSMPWFNFYNSDLLDIPQ
jgi:Reverse transcriptase (RNA-dependent DNA polymerase)